MQVTITGITTITIAARRLLQEGIRVDFEVELPEDVSSSKAEAVVASLSDEELINEQLAETVRGSALEHRCAPAAGALTELGSAGRTATRDRRRSAPDCRNCHFAAVIAAASRLIQIQCADTDC